MTKKKVNKLKELIKLPNKESSVELSSSRYANKTNLHITAFLWMYLRYYQIVEYSVTNFANEQEAYELAIEKINKKIEDAMKTPQENGFYVLLDNGKFVPITEGDLNL